jgi:hypothetical protein
MFGIGTTACTLCGHRVARKSAMRAPAWDDVAICPPCYEAWARAGRTCAECQVTVAGTEAVSAFLAPRRSFGHARCGGVALTT